MISLEKYPLLVSPDWLELPLAEPHSSLSWAVVGGGWLTINKAYWIKVTNSELGPDILPEEFFRNRLAQKGEKEEVLGFMTSASLLDHSISIQTFEEYSVRCVATVGLGNALRIGAPPKQETKIGTINVLVQTSHPLTFSASLEAMSLAAEARTLAVWEAKVKSKIGENLATGTGTDCIGILSPSRTNQIDYVGKHTHFGHLIGKSVYLAVQEGITNWKIRSSTILSDKANSTRRPIH